MAMARKWRPKSFQDMVGQEHIAQTLQNAIEGGRLHHAFLFTGTRGVGKTTSARILARTLNCAGGDPLHPCGECASCKEIENGSSMDVLEVDAASNTGVDNIRDLLANVQYAPMNGKYKVFIIDEVHMLSTGAFNALLKTLEEPPAHVIFIFATTEVNKVPQTILSRVQRFDFKRLTSEQIISRLNYICDQESITTDHEALSIIAEKADGSMRDALTYFDQAYAFTGNEMKAESVRSVLGIPPNELYFSLLDAIGNHDIKNCFLMVEKAASIGVEYGPFLDGFAKFLRNVLYIRVGSVTPETLNISEELFGHLKSAGASLGNGDLLRIAKMLTDTQGALRYSANPRLLLETTLARMAWLDHLTDLRKVLAAIQNPASGEAKKKLAELAPQPKAAPKPVQNPQDISLEDLKIFDDAPVSEPPSFDEGPLEPPPTHVQGMYAFLEDVIESETYTRREIFSAWGEILKRINDDGDMLFAASLEGSTISTDNIDANPFPITLTFRSKLDGTPSWPFQQFTGNSEFQDKLVQKLEGYLNTQIILQVTLAGPSEGGMRPKRQQTPYEKDFEMDESLQKLHELFNTEWLGTRRLPKERQLQQDCVSEVPNDN